MSGITPSPQRAACNSYCVPSPKATAIFQRIEQGELVVRTADTVIFETVFTLQRGYKQERSAMAAALLPLIELPGIILPGKRAYRKYLLNISGPNVC